MKRKLFKRITAMALALLMVGTAIPSGSDFTGLFGSEITASAETFKGKCGENAEYSLDTSTGKLTISGTGAMYDYSSVAQIYSSSAPWSGEKRKSVKSIEIAEGITNIGNYAFFYLNKLDLHSVTIPASVKSIGKSAFDNTNLESVTLLRTVNLSRLEKTHSAGVN